MQEGAIWVGSEGNIIYMNTSAKQLLGISDPVPENMEKAFEDFETQPELNKILTQKARWLACDFVSKNSKYYVLGGTSGRLEADSKLQGFLLVFRDVTEERRQEKIKRTFLALISHKLRTPLTSIIGFLDVADKSDFKDESIGKGLHISLKQAKKLHQHVDKLLTFVSAQDPIQSDLRPVPLKELLQETLNEMESFFSEHSVKVQYDLKDWEAIPPVPMVFWTMKETLKNLLENAIKFNREKEKKVAIRVLVKDKNVRIDVEDNGPGIPPEMQTQLFSKFYQGEDSFTGQVEGLGLGLAFAKTVIERHGGHIELQSKLKQGSTVYITLPLE